jgi:hypothetical protein
MPSSVGTVHVKKPLNVPLGLPSFFSEINRYGEPFHRYKMVQAYGSFNLNIQTAKVAPNIYLKMALFLNIKIHLIEP